MSARVLLPWTDIDVPEGVEAAYYDGVEPPPAELADVEAYVLPYARGPEPPKLPGARRAPRRIRGGLPALGLVQAPSAGGEALVPLLPEGVRLANGRGFHALRVAEH